MMIRNSNLKPLLLSLMMLVGLASCDNRGNGTEGGAVAVDGVAEPAPTPVGAIEDESLGVEVPVLLQEYNNIKNALVNDNYEQARQAAAGMQQSLENAPHTLLSDAQKSELKENARQLAQSQDIEAVRRKFADLSRQLYQVVKTHELTDQTLYWQHCPMALDGKGANWLSMEEKVQNPYMGQSMPNCGTVQETLN